MTLDILLSEAQELPEDVLMEVVRFVRFMKTEIQTISSTSNDGCENRKIIQTAGKYRGKIKISEDFDEPLDEFKEYL